MGTKLCTDNNALEFSKLSGFNSLTRLSKHAFEANLKVWELTDGVATFCVFQSGRLLRLLSPSRCYIALVTSLNCGSQPNDIFPSDTSAFTPRGTSGPFFDSTLLRAGQRVLTDKSYTYFTIYLCNGVEATARNKFVALAKALDLERMLIADDALAERLLYAGPVSGLSQVTPSAIVQQKDGPMGISLTLPSVSASPGPLAGKLNLGGLLPEVRTEADDDRERRMRECAGVASEIVDGKLFVSGEAPTKDIKYLKSLGITTIINMSPANVPNSFPDDFTYLTLDVYDTSSEDLTSLFPIVLLTIVEGGKVLLHCHQGVSRSITMAIAYVMWNKGMSVDAALDAVKARRNVASPNPGFLSRLYQYQAALTKQHRPLSLLRFGAYRGDATLPLVMHELSQPVVLPECKIYLDSRTYYLFVFEDCAFLWKGRDAKKLDEALVASTNFLRFGFYTEGGTHTSTTRSGETLLFASRPTILVQEISEEGDERGGEFFRRALKKGVGRPDIEIVASPQSSLDKCYTKTFQLLCSTGRVVSPTKLSGGTPMSTSPLALPSPPTAPAREETTNPSGSSGGGIVVMRYPDYEEDDGVFDFADLLPSEAYIIVRHSGGDTKEIHGWVGRDSAIALEPNQVIDAYLNGDDSNGFRTSVTVEGEESDAFMDLWL